MCVCCRHALFEKANVHLERGEAQAAALLFTRSAAAFGKAAKAGRATQGTLLPTLLSNLGNALTEIGRMGEASDAYERAVAAPPPTCLAYNGLSNCYECLGRYEEARAASARGVKLLPSCDLAHYNLGRLLRNAERSLEASIAFTTAVAIKPTDKLCVRGPGASGRSHRAAPIAARPCSAHR